MGVMQGVISERWQPLFTTAGMVAFVISMLVGVMVALTLGAAFGLHVLASAGIGVGAGLVAEWTLFKHQRSEWHGVATSF